MRTRIRACDWAALGLGAIPTWPQYMKTAIDILLGLPTSGALLWGHEGVVIYNDAFAEFAGRLHPALLGSKVLETLPAHIGFNAQVMAEVLGGGSLAYRDQQFTLTCDGEELVWLNLDYCPVLDENGRPAGVFALVNETTGRVQAEKELLESQSHMSAIFEHAKVGLSELSPEGAFLRVNGELCGMLGRTRETLLNARICDVTHPDDLPNSMAAIARMMKTGQPVTVDKRYVRLDGRLVWARSSLSLLDYADRPCTILAVTVDLTQRKHAEQALAESEARFRALAEASPVLIWQLDTKGNAVYLNPRYLDVTGASSKELHGKGWQAFLHPDDALQFLAEIAAAQQARAPLRQRARARSKSGEWLWLESHAAPWFDSEGAYAGHVGIALDITEAVNAQEELLVSNERLKLAIEGSGDGVWDWDMRNDALLYSKRLKEIIGLSEKDTIDRREDWEALTHPEEQERVAAALNACLKGETSSLKSEHRIRCKNGSYKWVLLRAIVVARDKQGRPLRMAGTLTDISEKRSSEEVVWRHANFDSLTGLPNRRLFRDRLEYEVKKAHRTGLPLALLFIDLDHFKEANDLLGHDIGDQLLTEAGKRISYCVRQSDTVARLGGDEFTAILADLDDLAHVEMIAQKVIEALASPFQLGNEVVYLSASVGITLYPEDATYPEDLLRNADQAMYTAKNGGRNQFSYFTHSMQQKAHARLRLIGDLRHALSGNQLRVYYQPMIELATGRVTKAEALLRWQHPKLGLIDPPRFIPFAEESGLINEIGEWVFRQAAACSKKWGEQVGAPFQISVNKSPVQFLSRVEESDWPAHLRSLGLEGSSISVEITENLLLNASASVVDKLLQYRDAGIQVTLDDFGTGYSSMAYLRKFDIDYLKIDKSFVRDVNTDAGDRAIVRSIIVMAHELGLKVIAEGIETLEQKKLLTDAGCDYGQGFLFSQAVPAEEFELVLQR